MYVVKVASSFVVFVVQCSSTKTKNIFCPAIIIRLCYQEYMSVELPIPLHKNCAQSNVTSCQLHVSNSQLMTLAHLLRNAQNLLTVMQVKNEEDQPDY